MSEIELQDSILRHALELLRLSAGEQSEMDAIMRELVRDIETLLASHNLSAANKAELKAIIAEARKVIDARYAVAAKSVDSHAIAIVVAEHTTQVIAPVTADAVRRVTVETLASLTKDVLIDGAPSSAWWAKQSDEVAFKFAAQLRQGVVNGETNERIVQRIVGKGGEPGIMDVARRNARTLVHSSVMTAANDARLATYRANARFIKGVRWLSTLDSRTCVQCSALDRQAWSLDGEKLPGTTVDYISAPAHFSCRCTMSPIPKSEPATGPTIGARASKDGPIAAGTTFDEFLKRQSPEFIDKMLGKKRADLFRAGRITLRDLVSGTGRELTLEQIR